MSSRRMGKGYYAYVILGLIAVVVVLIVASTNSTDPSGKDAIPFIIGSIGVFIVGLLIFQWRNALAYKPSDAPDPHAAQAGKGTKDAGQVGSFEEITALLATEEYNEEQLRRGRQGSYGVMKAYMVGLTIIVPICLILGALLITGNLGNPGEWKYFRYMPFILAPLAFAFIYFLMGRGGEAASNQLAPLGLSITEMPKPGVGPDIGGGDLKATVHGATVMKGTRHGRPVEIRLAGNAHTTTVRGKTPEFEVVSDGDRLQAKSGPASISDAVAAIAPSSHWKKLKSVEGGPEGVVAERKVDTNNGWIRDLWLCELLADTAKRRK